MLFFFNTAPHIKAVVSSTVAETRADKRSKGVLESDEVQSCNRKPDPVLKAAQLECLLVSSPVLFFVINVHAS